ncbi:MAG: BF3164 family lipoprotein [Cyclobacteriaceae bacterium]
MKANKLLIILILGFFPGCHQEQNHFSFKKEISLTGVEAKIKEVLNPESFLVFDSLLLIKEPHFTSDTRKKLKILNLNDFSLISNAVWLGRGPGEMVNPASWVIDEEHKILMFSDWGKHRIFMFPIDSLVSNPDFYATDYVSYHKAIFPMMNVFYHPSGNVGFTSFNLQQDIVSFIDKQGQIVDSLAIPNKFNRDFWENAGFTDNPLILHYNPHHNKIVVATKEENFIAVIDEEGNPVFQLEGPAVISESPNDMERWKKYKTFYQITSDQEFIYCLYRGGPMGFYDRELERLELNYPKTILVFDWQGSARFKINLCHELLYMTVDAERNRLIGRIREFENQLIIYDFSALK